MFHSSSSLPLRRAGSLALALAATAAMVIPVAASAQRVLPPPEYRLLIAGHAEYPRAPGSYTFAGASLSATPFPQPALMGSATGNPVLGAGLEGDITYYFAVDGPIRDLAVPLLVTFVLNASVQGSPADASALFGISFARQGDFVARVDADSAHASPPNIFETRAFEMISGGPFAQAFLSIRAASFNGLAQAFADPFIFIDPIFLAGHPGYAVSVSPGIGNAPFVSPVPEPETWAAMLLGLGCLGAASRRRRATRRTVPTPLPLLVAGLLATSGAHAEHDPAPPTLMPVQFSLQAQAIYLGQQGTASSNLFFASGSLGGTGPRVAVQGEGVSSMVNAENQASAQALWAFRIDGPAGVDVPILITGLYGAEQNNALSVSGGLALGVDRFRLGYVMTFRCIDGDSSGCDSSRGGRPQDFVLHETAASGALTFLQIATGGALRGRGTGGPGSFSAFVDPLVSIDPAFPRFAEFTLYVSPGAAGFVTAVPEPETYALLLAGLAVVGGVARRRRPRR